MRTANQRSTSVGRTAYARAVQKFDGIPAAAFDFYDELVANNSKSWWTEHRADYERFVREPMTALLDALAGEFGPGRLFRPYNNTRFHKNLPPIKEHQGGVVHVEDAIAYYVQVSGAGLLTAGGWYSAQGQQLASYRTSVAGPAGSELARIMRTFDKSWTVEGDPLKTHPRGFDPAHPRIDLLRNRRLSVSREYAPSAQLGTAKVVDLVRKDWRKVQPLIEWLADNVGPAAEPAHEPDE